MGIKAMLLALPLAAAAALGPGSAGAQSASSTSSVTVQSFGEALSAFRAQAGLGPVSEDAALDRAAQAFAEDMARHGYFSHTGRDGGNVADRARAAGCRSRGYYAENIAWGQDSANDSFQGWAASPGHRANMLGSRYKVYGLGQAGGYWVLIFSDRC